MIYRTQGREPEPTTFHTCPESDPGPDDPTTASECKACFPVRAPRATQRRSKT